MREIIRNIIKEYTLELMENSDNRNLGTKEFIKRAKKIHGNFYDYSNVDYVNNHTKVEIKCPIHGVFYQAPVNHVNAKQGCPDCGIQKNKDRQNMTKNDFISQSILLHGDKYKYNKVNFIDNRTPVEIICQEHGSFFQSPKRHIKGSICPKCAILRNAEARTKWTLENIKKEIKKYDSISEFQRGSVGAYVSSVKNGWWEELKKNFPVKKIIWTKEEIQKLANNYLHRGEFCEKHGSACNSAKRNGWYEEIVKHMEPVGNKYNRAVYVFEFPDKSVYVGLTGNVERREKSHIEEEENSAVLLHMLTIGKKPTMKIVSDGYINYKDAQNMEGCTLEKYKAEGWKILNRAKTGSLGSCTRVWTLQMLKDLSKKYKTRSEFVEKQPNAYAAAARNGWLDDVFEDMKRLINPNNTWTYEVVAKEASKYNRKKDFFEGSPHAYYAAKRNGWFDELTKNYKGNLNNWTLENIEKEAKKYKSRKEFWDSAGAAARNAMKLGIMDKLFPKK